MLKKFKAFHLVWLALYLVSLLNPALPYFEYVVNKSYISQVLCENRDKPRLKCDGKCYLAKQVAASESSDTTERNSEQPPKINLKDFPITDVNKSVTLELLSAQMKNHFLLYYLGQVLPGYKSSLIQPPDCA